MKNKRGVSLLAIVIAIAVIIIISTSAIFEYKNVVIKGQKIELAKDFYTMTKLVNDYEFMHSNYPVTTGVECVVNKSALPEEIIKTQFANEPIEDDKMTFQYIDHNKLSTEELIRGAQKYGIEDRYVFSIWTKRVYYLPGVTIGDTTYYTLTNDLYKLLDISEVK